VNPAFRGLCAKREPAGFDSRMKILLELSVSILEAPKHFLGFIHLRSGGKGVQGEPFLFLFVTRGLQCECRVDCQVFVSA